MRSRKLMIGGVVATVSLAGLTAAAEAQTASKFSVIALTRSSHPSGSSIIVRSTLVEPGERSEVLGHDLAKFTPRGDRVRARIVFFFADGSLKAKGVFGPGDDKIAIIGGSGRWDGASGKVKLRNAGPGAERYTFTVVQ
jgi:hypothetical protein